MITQFILGVILYSDHGIAFSTNNSLSPRFQKRSLTICRNWLGDLWEEVIEFSTYGPEERKLLKEKREKSAAATLKEGGGKISMDSFQQAQQKYASKTPGWKSDESSSSSIAEDDSLSMQAFQSAVASKKASNDDEIDFDGYKLRDLLVEKWGVPLDIDFQRGFGGTTVYCTILPIAFGSSRCRHESELDYLMHLEGVIEVLQTYDNLDPFIFYVQKTNKVPKPGIESVPYLMKLDDNALKKIL